MKTFIQQTLDWATAPRIPPIGSHHKSQRLTIPNLALHRRYMWGMAGSSDCAFTFQLVTVFFYREEVEYLICFTSLQVKCLSILPHPPLIFPCRSSSLVGRLHDNKKILCWRDGEISDHSGCGNRRGGSQLDGLKAACRLAVVLIEGFTLRILLGLCWRRP